MVGKIAGALYARIAAWAGGLEANFGRDIIFSMKPVYLLTTIFLALFLLANVTLKAQAQFATPTPGPDGRIIWIVEEGQSCSQISTLTGVPLSQLRALNNLDESCILTPGQQLVIGIGGPSGSEPTSVPNATATLAPPTQTPVPGSIDVCVLLYNDENGDSLRQELEPAIEGGAVSIAGTSGQYSQTGVTVAGLEPICFTGVPLGTFNISVAAPAGYNPTTLLNYTLEIKPGDLRSDPVAAGDRVFIDFGAQLSNEAPAPEDPAAPAAGGEDNTLLGIVGGALLLTGAGLAIYTWRVYGRRPTLPN